MGSTDLLLTDEDANIEVRLRKEDPSRILLKMPNNKGYAGLSASWLLDLEDSQLVYNLAVKGDYIIYNDTARALEESKAFCWLTKNGIEPIEGIDYGNF